jgi:hypothetical protein
MKRHVMQPFRAPRQQKEKASPTRQSPRRQDKQDKEVHAIPYKKGVKMMSYREANEVAEHGEVLRWSSEREGEGEETTKAHKYTPESEEATELGLVWKPLVIEETQYNDIEELIDNGIPNINDRGKRYVIEARVDSSLVEHDKQPAIGATAASPSCSDFEAFLESKSVSAIASEGSVSGGGHKKISKTDAYWNNVLEVEKQRFAAKAVDSFVPVDAIMLDISSDDDDVPIVATLTSNKNNLSLLVDVATHSVSSPTIRQKSQPKVCHWKSN